MRFFTLMTRKIAYSIPIQCQKTLPVFSFLLEVVWKTSKRSMLFFFIVMIVAGSCTALEAWAITEFINGLHDTEHHLFFWFLCLIGSMLLKEVAMSAQPLIAGQLNENVGEYLKTRCYEKASSLDLIGFDSADYYDSLERSKQASNKDIGSTIESVARLSIHFIEFIVVIIAVAHIHAYAAILLLIGVTPVALSLKKANHAFIQVNYQQSPLQRQLNYWRDLSTKKESAAELRLFGLSNFFLNRWKTISHRKIDDMYKAKKKVANETLLSFLGVEILIGVVIGALVFSAVYGTISIGLLVATLYLLNRFEEIVRMTSFYIDDISRFYNDFQYLPDFLKHNDIEKPRKKVSPRIADAILEFKDVSFTYPGQTKPAIHHINLTIHSGETIAVVGENGAGKSTIAKLFLNLYEPTYGTIVVNGLRLNETDWQPHANAVFQNYMRYHLTVRENIGIGSITDIHNDEKMYQAAKETDFLQDIRFLKQGLNTMLGHLFSDGKDLSGGQWQKIALVRSNFRDSPFVVFDEPAASLDPKTEFQLYHRLRDMAMEKTVLFITHRLGSAQLADRIIFLSNGTILEEGSHEKLMHQNGAYARLYKLQSSWYTTKEAGF
ncbi:ABC transporter ATP-binding protein [Aureibacillus halotolerans]|uniref:ATP-binding cassette subfamily B protein n=1 Tax=Aureibacillus halotolerans TaxID=1508390 RepID=A0A4V3D618_9BACI|nr:ABC transporter ATP-binding protein [Aureibacillus halotolerans]TDQ42017.1 ATP-binding cassette subfamily B protein [Aureibacillus halotolerans]